MAHSYRTIQYSERKELSFSSAAIILIFFLVTSQIFILPLPSIATQMFRPLLIVMIIIHIQHSGSVQHPARIFAFLVGVHAIVVLLFYRELWTQENISNGVAVALFFLMFSFAIGVNWSKRELRWILLSCFFGCFVCATALLASNNPTDFNAATSGHLDLVGYSVNRNKNAYQYAFGSVLGLIYLLKGKNNHKLLVLLMEAVVGYALLYSQCRGAFLSFVGGTTVLFAALLLELRRKGSSKVLLYLVLLIIGYFVVYYLLKNSELSRLVDGDSKSGRDEGIKAAWRLFVNSDWFGKVFGNGFGFEEMQTGAIGAHLVYVSFLVSIGLIGSVLTALTFLSSLKYSYGAGSISLIVVAILKTFFESADYNVFIPLILAVIVSNYSKISRRDYYELFGREKAK